MENETNKERLETIEIILNKLKKDEYFDFFDRIILNILIYDYKELLKGKQKNEYKRL